ncbi:MAG: type II secretion system protein [bacterium]
MENLKKGFTLAEVLVTLTIIGVLAALTLPLLMSGTNEVEAKTSVKKAMLVLNQSMKKNMADNSTDGSSCTGCNLASTNGEKALAKFFAANIKTLNFTPDVDIDFYTPDGMRFIFYHNSSSSYCDDSTVNINSAVCGVTVDINGNRGQSRNGGTQYYSPDVNPTYTDLYRFVIRTNDVTPTDCDGQIAIKALKS